MSNVAFQPIVDNFNKVKDNFNETKKLLESLKDLGLDTTEIDKILSDAKAPVETKADEPKPAPEVSKEKIDLKDIDSFDSFYIARLAFEGVLTAESVKKDELNKDIVAYQVTGSELTKEVNGKSYVSIDDIKISSKSGLLKKIEETDLKDVNKEAKMKAQVKIGEYLFNNSKDICKSSEWQSNIKEATDFVNKAGVKDYLKTILKDYGQGLDKLNGFELYMSAVLANKGVPSEKVNGLYSQISKTALGTNAVNLAGVLA